MARTRGFAISVDDQRFVTNTTSASVVSESAELFVAAPVIKTVVYPGDDTAANTVGGQTIKLTGNNFRTGVQVYVNGNAVPSVTYNSSSNVVFTTPALSAATYPIYLVNTDGSVAIFIPGLQISGEPTWSTSATLPQQNAVTAWNISLSATSDSSVTYALADGSSLPAGISLAANGLISGTLSSPPNEETTYNFTVVASDAENQDASRAFSVSVTLAEEIFIPTSTTLLLGLKFNDSNVTQSGSLNITLNQSLTYQNSGGVLDTGYSTGWNITQGITISSFTAPANTLNKTYSAWYNGTQTQSGGTFSPSIPIFSDNSVNVYWGFGISDQKITIANGAQNKGTTNVATGQWTFLTWTVTSGGVCNAFVNGVKEVANVNINTGYPGAYRIGSGYEYAGTTAPTALDAVSIFDGILTDQQILEMYEKAS